MMKKALFLFFALLVTLDIAAQGRCCGYISDADGYVNVRQQPTTQSKIVKRLPRGNECYGTETYVGGKRSRWIGVLDSSSKLFGYVYETKVICTR